MKDDERWMERALELARRGEAQTHPNPMVGCVMVRGGEVVGEGFHLYEKSEHAEIVALRRAGERARGATLYVNLEPCCVTGRTGPCTEAIAAAGVKRVVAAMRDPNPAVAGRGLAELRRAGVQVEAGVREEEAQKLNEAFACWIRTRKPYVTLKSALTLDGQLRIAQRSKQKSATWITSEESRAHVQRMRHAADALLTGIGTVLADDPLLTDRSGLPRRRKLLRVILDSRLRLPLRSKIVKTAERDVLVFTTLSPSHRRAKRLQRAGVEVLRVPSRGGHADLQAALKELGARNILSVLLEAGSTVNGAALAAGSVNKLFLFYAPKVAGSNDVPFARAKQLSLPALEGVTLHQFGPDYAIEGYLTNVYRNR